MAERPPQFGLKTVFAFVGVFLPLFLFAVR
jgi:hypothetical protein